MKKHISFSLLILLISAILFQSCNKDENLTPGKYSDGVFITNEGTYGGGNGSISFYSIEGDSVVNNIFEKANNRTLGDVVQSLYLLKNKAYICVNNSNKIEIANISDFTEAGVIEDVPLVRHFIGINAEKAYASVWGDGGQLKVIDLNTNSVIKSIDVGNGPEKMAVIYNKLYVTNSGGFMSDNTISVVDTETDNVLKSITLDADKPVDLIIDDAGKLWVLCMGKTVYDQNWMPIDNTPAKLIRINTETDKIEKSVVLSQNFHPNNLEISADGNYFYYGGGFEFSGIYKISVTALSVSANPIISKSFYGFKVSENGEIFATEAVSFIDNGKLYRYQGNGTLINEYTVGIAPNGAAFKK
ncbi:MAG: SMP-30/gluconolactonase/LRE family protein [Bacteroidales bacterium]|nr:SMP-30/gluconolactonase/LRE family protein [Bacteroidales bacterium]MBN2758591.1 SMP-30/gluconolactonase/LRE family protein [Bacteroidales bacterium]